MSSEFDGLRALVTGGSSGIGLATARRLRDLGANVAVLDLEPPPSDLQRFVRASVADAAAVDAAVAEAVGQLGGLDVLVNNAGVGAVGAVGDNDDAEWLRVLDINVLGVMRVTKAALPALRVSATAAIVNTCSVVASVGLPMRAVYTASKGAVQSLTLSMAADLLGDGIRVNAVNPGTADTPWIERLVDATDDPDATRLALEARQPMGRLVTAAEVADAIVYLASPRSASTTATILAVDGGMQGLRLPPR